jgi:sigma-E factor negative regulatory protein RseA
LGWQLAGGLADPPDAQQVMLRDPQLDAMLAAHRQAGGAPALQMSAGFLRNATFEGTSR